MVTVLIKSFMIIGIRVDLKSGMKTEAILATKLPERTISMSSGLMLILNFLTVKNGASSAATDPAYVPTSSSKSKPIFLIFMVATPDTDRIP